jgi:hypothetical protein
MAKRHPISQFLLDHGVYYERLYKINNKLSITRKWWDLTGTLNFDELRTLHHFAKNLYGPSATVTQKHIISFDQKGIMFIHKYLMINYQKGRLYESN